MMRHLIVGTGPAGLAAMETILALDETAQVSLLGAEPPYARMVLPYFLAGKVEERAVMTGDPAWFEAKGVTTRFDARVVALDPAAHRVELDDGSAQEYDRLLIATGSRVARPDIPGLGESGVLDMWTLADARSFLGEPRPRVAVVGAGFIAFTVLDALAARAEKVRFAEILPQILPNMLDGPSAALLQRHLASRGIEIHTGARVEGVAVEEGGYRVELSKGGPLRADGVVMATGVQPNIGFLEGSGIELGRGDGAGILVDERLATSAPDVYAAGDVAEGLDLLTGERRVHAIQPTAVDHGRVAGANMAGQEVRYAGSLAMNVLSVQGLEACSFGLWSGEGREAIAVENPADGIYRKYVWDGDRLVGGVMTGPSVAVTGINDAGMLKGLIQTGVSLGSWKAYLEENPLDLRRPFTASGAARALLETRLHSGRIRSGGGFRLPALPARRERSRHHATLLEGAQL